MSMEQLDYGISPPGLIERAWCYSFFLGKDALYAVVVAKGWRVGYAPKGFGEKLGAKFGRAWAEQRAEKGYAVLEESSMQELMAENKRSYKASYDSISDMIAVTEAREYPQLEFVAEGKKRTYEFDGPSKQECVAFFDQLRSRLG